MSDFTSYSRVLNAGLAIPAFTSSVAASKAAEASSAISAVAIDATNNNQRTSGRIELATVADRIIPGRPRL